MQTLRPETHISEYFERLRRSRSSALLLDYDGTLAPFRVDRDQARPYVGVRERLETLCQSSTENRRVVIISGRRCREILPLLGENLQIELWGEHGWERQLTDGTIIHKQISENAHRALQEAAKTAQQSGWDHYCEQKLSSIAVHWRGLDGDQVEKVRQQAIKAWHPLTKETGLILRPFDGGVELRWGWFNKGDAVEEILRECSDDCVVAYAGDDATDEDAFIVLEGRGLRVLVRNAQRPTFADVWLQPPHELLKFMDEWIACTCPTQQRVAHGEPA